uniref:Activator 1 subunit 5 n=1 Tax=Steinernema glaseri TaxID=37863 RepID=A0A1I7ZFX3_9BILA
MASSSSQGVPTGKNLPWVEKYRPHTMDQLVSHTEIIKTLTNLTQQNRLPHLLFYGPPGTGKTSTILACARTMYTPQQYKSVVLELNASDDRGIDVVREQIISFSQSKSLVADVSKCVKLVILDEADAMTKDAQNALRRVIEKYSDNVRFCMICNYLSKIIPAIQSRCMRFRFAPLKTEQIVPRLLEIAKAEDVNLTDDGKDALLALAEGDMRRVLNILQSTAMAFPVVNEENIYTCVGQPLPVIIKNILRILLNETVEDAIGQIGKMCSDRCYALQDIVTSLHKFVLLLDIPPKFVCKLLEALADIEVRLAAGCSDGIQLGCLVGTFMHVRDEIHKAKKARSRDDDDEMMETN